MLKAKKQSLLIMCLILILVIAIFIQVKLLFTKSTNGQDIYYIWLEGKRILAGENPYARILGSDLRVNDKYATYFPLFYLLGAATQLLGFREYSDWIVLWRTIFLIFNLGIAGLLFYQFYRYKMAILGFFAGLFWLFNRWTIYVSSVAQIDDIAIFFLLVSLVIFNRKKYLSFILFSVSLGIKQIAIFLIPIYLIFVWNESEKKVSQTFTALLLILSIPALTGLPFIFWNAEGFFKSIIFSATRNPGSHIAHTPSLDVIIGNRIPGFVGIKAKIPMLMVMFTVYLSALKRQIGIYTSSCFTMFTFVNFNSVLFIQYFPWAICFIPLLICDFLPNKNTTTILRES